MATNYLSPGDVIVYANGGADINSGDIVVIGSDFCGVALVDITSGESGSVAVEGVFNLPSTGSPVVGDRVGTAATGGSVSTGGSETVGVVVGPTTNNITEVKLSSSLSAT